MTLMVKGRTFDSAALICVCLSFLLFPKSFLDSALSFIGSLAHVSHTHLESPDLPLGPSV